MEKKLSFFARLMKKRADRAKKSEVVGERPKSVALVLGGGGARGFAHIGALRAFEEANINFDFCIGTSVGAVVGALYCADVKSKEMEQYASGIDLKNIHNGLIIKPNDPQKIGKIVTDLIGDADIKSLKKPFYAVSVDLISGKQVVLDSGKVGTAVSASSCVPVFFKPVKYNEYNLVDGGLLNNIPADTAKMLGATKTVAVDINPTRGGGTTQTGIIDVIKASFSIMGANSSIMGLQASDILIAPDMSKFSSAKKDGYKEMIEVGYNTAKEQIPLIQKMLDGQSIE